MAAFDIESVIKNGVERALNEPIMNGKSVMQWAEIGMHSQEQWISVKDRLPEKDGKYLCVWQGRSINTGMFTNGHFRLYGEVKDKLVSHWMSLPEPPKEELDD